MTRRLGRSRVKPRLDIALLMQHQAAPTGYEYLLPVRSVGLCDRQHNFRAFVTTPLKSQGLFFGFEVYFDRLTGPPE